MQKHAITAIYQQEEGYAECYANLANAIIERAVDDYRMAGEILRLDDRRRHAQAVVKDVERFIRSDWFGQLTSVDAKHLLRQLRAEQKRLGGI